MARIFKYNVLSGIFVVSSLLIFANDDYTSINVAVDVKSQHVWRGSLSSGTTSIQPSLTYKVKNLSGGIWAAQSMDGQYSEMDLFLEYNTKQFSFAIYDYYCPSDNYRNADFINFNNHNTKHSIDLNMTFNGTEKVPIQILASTIVYGDDKNPGNSQNYYSTYFEIGYTHIINNNLFNLFLGFTPGESYYHNSFGVVNTGIQTTKEIRTAKITIPIEASIITNPSTNSFYMVLGLTL